MRLEYLISTALADLFKKQVEDEKEQEDESRSSTEAVVLFVPTYSAMRAVSMI